MQRIFTISYVSQCIIPLEDRPWELKRLVSVSTKNYAVRYISGLLTLQEDRFLQDIEGAESDVERTFDAIRRDKRHVDVTMIAHKEIPQRQFSRWIFGLAGRSAESRSYFSEIKDISYLNSHDRLCSILEDLAKIDAA